METLNVKFKETATAEEISKAIVEMLFATKHNKIIQSWSLTNIQ